MSPDHFALAASNRALLTAALSPDAAAAAAAWRAWRDAADLDALPAGQYLMLPALYANLARCGLAEEADPRIKGVYRRTWYANRGLIELTAAALAALDGADVPAVLAGAAALAHTVYPQPALRPLFQPEVIVPLAGADAALRALRELGWRAQPAAPHLHSQAYRDWVAGQHFVNGQGQALWLGWHVVPSLPCADLDAACWAAAIELTLDGRSVRTLCPADHLLRACLAAPEAGLIALADVAWLLRGGAVDWPRLMEMAGRFRAGQPLLHMLETLAATIGLAAPPAVLSKLGQLPVFWAERRIPPGLAGLAQPGNRRQRFWQLLTRYQRAAACAGRTAGPLSFVAYVQHTRHLDSPWRLPLAAVRRRAG